MSRSSFLPIKAVEEKQRILPLRISLGAVAMVFLFAPMFADSSQLRRVEFKLPVQALSNSLKKVAGDFDLKIAFFSTDVSGVDAPPLNGTFSASQAFEILLSGTALEYEYVNSSSLVVKIRQVEIGGGTAKSAAKQQQNSSKSAVLEEVIVTAQKKAESLQNVPISISAVGREKIQDNFIMSLEQVSAWMPNVTITDSTAAEQLFIRGIGSGANEGFEQSVGTYVDGIYYGRGRSAKTGFLDMARIEVLKGPQGVLFGKNTIAGAINITTRNPTQAFEASMRVGYETEHKEKILEGIISSPITDTVAARFAIRSSQHDGWMDNTFLGEDAAQSKELAARLTTVWDAAENLQIVSKIQYTDLALGDRAAQLTQCSAATQAIVAGIDDCRFDDKTTLSMHSASGEDHGYEDYNSLSIGVTANWKLGAYTLTSVTGYTQLDSDQALELDFTHLDVLSADPRLEQFEAFSQELRIVSPAGKTIEYIAGLYYEQSELYRENSFNLPALARVGQNWQDGKSFAVFSSVDWNINDNLTLTVGGRYTRDSKDLHKLMFYSEPRRGRVVPIRAVPGLGAAHDVYFDREDEDFSPTVTLQWNPLDKYMYYFNYSEGFKAGGYDIASGSAVEGEVEFQPETVNSFEAGAKTTLLEGTMELNLAVFRSEFSDLQVSTFDGNFSLLVGNAAEAIAKGVELDMRWALNENFTLNASFAYLDAEYGSYKAAQCANAQTAATPTGVVCVQDLSGAKLIFAPETAGNLGLAYEQDIGSQLRMRITTDIIHTAEYWVAGDHDPNVLEDGFTKINAMLAIGSVSGQWECALLVKNLTDEATSHWGNDVPAAPGSYYKYLDRTRTFTLSANYKF